MYVVKSYERIIFNVVMPLDVQRLNYEHFHSALMSDCKASSSVAGKESICPVLILKSREGEMENPVCSSHRSCSTTEQAPGQLDAWACMQTARGTDGSNQIYEATSK
ncbi:hypothetical protein AV530_019132 [Patagioenas fasciata monilis]|uniref:Uncharacterized protein n=1 Tax=Patagioenas fasciata monilis TaxID=372326 RepID=A0A1V4KXK0_PATFA|nr:hypothetical protein AV530_019132 [Patagioenas fasciata monilis]